MQGDDLGNSASCEGAFSRFFVYTPMDPVSREKKVAPDAKWISKEVRPDPNSPMALSVPGPSISRIKTPGTMFPSIRWRL